MTPRSATQTRITALGALLIALGGLVALALLSAPRADAVTASKAHSLWNQQRKMHGLPAGLVNRQALNDGCRKHNNYSAQNDYLGHDEDPANPHYTPEGWAAARSSVLGVGSPPWNTLNRNPWENAPIHLSQMLDPTLKFTGYDESQGYECATTLARYRAGYGARPSPQRTKLYTYPGPGTTIYRAQHTREGPFTPGQLVGIPQGKRTGPHLYVLIHPGEGVDDFTERADITRAWLKNPSGRKLGIAVIDETNDRIYQYIPAGGMIIPRRALRAGRRYTAHVVVKYAGQTLKRTWRFRTNSRMTG